MPEENFSQQDSLLLIESMIKKAKNRFGENGFLYLLWGWVILFCALGQYVLLFIVHSRYHYVVWMSTWLALVVQIIYIVRKRRKKTVSTYTEEIVRYVWLTFVIMLFLFGFIIQSGSASGHAPEFMISTTGLLALYGMPTFLSGVILRFRALILGGLGCWVLSVAAGFVPQQYQLLLVAAGVIMAWIVPGYMLRARYKKENELH